MIDIHTHILPGLDDGAKTLDDSVRMIRQAIDSGIKVICATPHVLYGVTPDFEKEINRTFKLLHSFICEKDLDIELTLGSEIYVRREMGSLRKFNFFSLNQTDKYVLMELPLKQLPLSLDQLIFSLKLEGIIPVIAHPERSVHQKDQLKDIENLIRLGAGMQINAGSVLGYFGKTCRKIAECMLKQNLVHVIASDAHDPSSCSVDVLPQAFQRVSGLVGKVKAERLFIHNPYRILKGKQLFENDEEADMKNETVRMGIG